MMAWHDLVPARTPVASAALPLQNLDDLLASYLWTSWLITPEALYNRMTTTVPFINSLSSGVNPSTARAHHTHDIESEDIHSHGPGEHGHTHEHLEHPGGSFRSLIIHKLMAVT